MKNLLVFLCIFFTLCDYNKSTQSITFKAFVNNIRTVLKSISNNFGILEKSIRSINVRMNQLQSESTNNRVQSEKILEHTKNTSKELGDQVAIAEKRHNQLKNENTNQKFEVEELTKVTKNQKQQVDQLKNDSNKQRLQVDLLMKDGKIIRMLINHLANDSISQRMLFDQLKNDSKTERAQVDQLKNDSKSQRMLFDQLKNDIKSQRMLFDELKNYSKDNRWLVDKLAKDSKSQNKLLNKVAKISLIQNSKLENLTKAVDTLTTVANTLAKQVEILKKSIPVIKCDGNWTKFNNRCFFGKKCKQFQNSEILKFCNANNGRSLCQSYGGSLAKVLSVEENNFIIKFSVAAGFLNTIIGGRDAYNNGSWVWPDGTPLKYTNWRGGNPYKYRGEHCVTINGFRNWSDNSCGGHYYDQQGYGYVCERNTT